MVILRGPTSRRITMKRYIKHGCCPQGSSKFYRGDKQEDKKNAVKKYGQTNGSLGIKRRRDRKVSLWEQQPEAGI